MATIVGRNLDGIPTVVIINSKTYSNSTSKHQREVWHILSRLMYETRIPITCYYMTTANLKDYLYNSRDRKYNRYSEKYETSMFNLNQGGDDVPVLSLDREQLWKRLEKLYWQEGKIKLRKRVDIATLDSLVDAKKLLKAL
jgi:hypothetical protein